MLAVVDGPTGFATQYMDPTTGQIQVVSGGAGAPPSNVYVVTNRKELLAALLNSNSPTFATAPMTAQNEPKIIYVSGSILGNQLDDGTLATTDTYRMTPNPNQYDFDLYVMSFDTQLIASLTAQANPDGGDADGGDAAAAAAQLALLKSQPGAARTTFSNNQKSQIQFQVPPNTSLLGVGQDAKLIDGYLSINTDSATFGKTVDSNIIIRNIEFQVPQDLLAGVGSDRHVDRQLERALRRDHDRHRAQHLDRSLHVQRRRAHRHARADAVQRQARAAPRRPASTSRTARTTSPSRTTSSSSTTKPR